MFLLRVLLLRVWLYRVVGAGLLRAGSGFIAASVACFDRVDRLLDEFQVKLRRFRSN